MADESSDPSWRPYVDQMMSDQKNAAVCYKSGNILAASPEFTHIQPEEIQRLVDNAFVGITLGGVKYQRVGDVDSKFVTGFNLKIKDAAGMTAVAFTKTLVLICQGFNGSQHYKTNAVLLNNAEFLMQSGY